MTLSSITSTAPTAGRGAVARGVAIRFAVPMAAGAVLFAIHAVMAVAGASTARGWGVWLWATGAGSVVLLVYGAVLFGRRVDMEHGRARAQLQALIDASPTAIVAGDFQGRIILWSTAAESLLGWSAADVLGRPYPAVPEVQEDRWRGLRRRVLSGETVHGLETQRITRDGRTIDVSVSAAPVRDGARRIVGTVALIHDRRGTREVEQLESQLRQAQKLEVVGRLAAGIAHDFNNLLTAIRGNAELIMTAEETPADLDVELGEIARSADRAAALTRQLLTFTAKEPMENRPQEVNEVVKGLETLIQRLIGETIELRVELSVNAGAVLVDPNQIEQVVMNLVVNARDALPDGGRIVVGTRPVDVTAAEAGALPYQVRPGRFAMITVTDNGVGMAPGIVDRIFEPFFTTKPAGVGTGLGLSTVYSIVKQARGHIRVESEPGAGTMFRIYLPRHEAEEAARAEEPAAAVPNGGSGTILVVEDEEAVLSMAQRTLERQGYKVLPALSGREALALALKHPGEIHVLFCDVVMPDLTGREVAERVMGARPDIAVLMTSGYGQRQLADDGVLEDLPFLPKPYTPQQLTSRIHGLVGQAV